MTENMKAPAMDKVVNYVIRSLPEGGICALDFDVLGRV